MGSDSEPESEPEEAPSEDEGVEVAKEESEAEAEEGSEPASEDEGKSGAGGTSAAEDSEAEGNAKLEALLKKVKQAELEKEKISVAEELHRYGNKNPDDLPALGARCVPWLLECMSTSSPSKLRAAAAGALWVLVGDATNTHRVLDTPGALKSIVEEAMPNKEKSEKSSPLLRENCLACLGNMSFHEFAHPRLIKADAAKAQIEGLSSQSVSVQWQSAYGLSNLAGSAAGRGKIPNTVLQRLFQIIRGKSTDKRALDTKVAALGAVNAISADQSRHAIIVKIFPDILDFVKDVPKKSNEWQQKCVDSIVYIGEQSDAYVKAWADRDAVEALFACLKSDPDMRRAAAAGLCLFARYGDHHKLLRRPDDSGISVLLKALEDKDSQAASLALQTIWNLAGHVEARKVLARKNAVHALQKRIQSAPAADRPAIMSVLCCMAKEDSVREEIEPLEVIRKLAKHLDSSDASLRQQAIVALGQLSGDDALMDWMIEAGVTSRLVQHICADEDEFQERVIETVQQVATSVTGAQALLKAGAVPLLMTALKTTSSMYVRQVSIGSLMNMAVDDGCCHEISSELDYEVLMGLTGLKDAPPEVPEYATGLVWHVSDLEESRERIAAHKGAVPCLLKLLESESDEVRENVCGAVANLATVASARAAIRKGGAIRHLVAAMRSEGYEVSRQGHLALQRLWEDEACRKEIEAVGREEGGEGALAKRIAEPVPPARDAARKEKAKEEERRGREAKEADAGGEEKPPREEKKKEKKKKKKEKKKEETSSEEEEPAQRRRSSAAASPSAAAAAPSPPKERDSEGAQREGGGTPNGPAHVRRREIAAAHAAGGAALVPIELSREAAAALERVKYRMKMNASMALLALISCWEKRERVQRNSAAAATAFVAAATRKKRRGESDEEDEEEWGPPRRPEGRGRERERESWERERERRGGSEDGRKPKRRREGEPLPAAPAPPLLLKIKLQPNPALIVRPSAPPLRYPFFFSCACSTPLRGPRPREPRTYTGARGT
eukprot:tig00001024_g6340.t1